LDHTQDAALFVAKVTGGLVFDVDSDFQLTGDIKSSQITIEKFYPYFKTSMTQESLNKKISFMSPLMISYLNSELEKGIDLPVNPNITKYIKEERVKTFDNYLLIEGKPDFQITENAVSEKEASRMKLERVLTGIENSGSKDEIQSIIDELKEKEKEVEGSIREKSGELRERLHKSLERLEMKAKIRGKDLFENGSEELSDLIDRVNTKDLVDGAERAGESIVNKAKSWFNRKKNHEGLSVRGPREEYFPAASLKGLSNRGKEDDPKDSTP